MEHGNKDNDDDYKDLYSMTILHRVGKCLKGAIYFFIYIYIEI